MTNEELVTVIQNGDPEHTATAALYSQNRGLIYKICEKYQPYAERPDAGGLFRAHGCSIPF